MKKDEIEVQNIAEIEIHIKQLRPQSTDTQTDGYCSRDPDDNITIVCRARS